VGYRDGCGFSKPNPRIRKRKFLNDRKIRMVACNRRIRRIDDDWLAQSRFKRHGLLDPGGTAESAASLIVVTLAPGTGTAHCYSNLTTVADRLP
jgi:hypothetical protein